MKKKIALLSTMLIAMVVLAGCNLPAATMSAGDSQTQVALLHVLPVDYTKLHYPPLDTLGL